jgi:uncharacterized C2H2 Zn-finger protein
MVTSRCTVCKTDFEDSDEYRKHVAKNHQPRDSSQQRKRYFAPKKKCSKSVSHVGWTAHYAAKPLKNKKKAKPDCVSL